MPDPATLAPRLAQLLTLAVGTSHDAEAVAALVQVRRLLAGAGATAADLVALLGAVAPAVAEAPPGDPVPPARAQWIEAANWALRHADILGDKDWRFVLTLAEGRWKGDAPSPAQQRWLVDILARLPGGHRARAAA
jgi:hypothetical protein